jgi:hypothetical protein
VPDDLLSTAQARRMLKLSPRKIAELIASGDIPTQPDPLDKRFKLIRRSDVEALLGRSVKIAA